MEYKYKYPPGIIIWLCHFARSVRAVIAEQILGRCTVDPRWTSCGTKYEFIASDAEARDGVRVWNTYGTLLC